MQRWIALLGLLVLASFAPAEAITRVGSAVSATNLNQLTCPVTYSPTPGNAVLVISFANQAVSSVTDNGTSGGSTYTSALTGYSNLMRVYYTANAQTSVTTITVTMTGDQAIACAVIEYAGLSTTPLDQASAEATGSGTDALSNDITTTQADELLIGLALNPNNTVDFTPGATWGNKLSQTSSVMGIAFTTQDKIVSSTGTYSAAATFGTSNTWYAWIVSFKGAAVATAPRRRVWVE